MNLDLAIPRRCDSEGFALLLLRFVGFEKFELGRKVGGFDDDVFHFVARSNDIGRGLPRQVCLQDGTIPRNKGLPYKLE